MKNVLFVLVEGVHDAAIVKRILTELGGFQESETPVDRFWEPLGGFLAQKLRTRTVSGRTLRQLGAAEPPSVQGALESPDQLVLLVVTRGKEQVEATRAFLSEVLLLASAQTWNAAQDRLWRVLLVVDADDDRDARLREIQSRYQDPFGPGEWSWGGWRPVPDRPVHVAAWVWPGPNQASGTLESLAWQWIRPGHEPLFGHARAFVSLHEALGTGLGGSTFARVTRRSKAALGILNQMHNPGTALTVLYGDKDLLSPDRNECAAFLQLFQPAAPAG